MINTTDIHLSLPTHWNDLTVKQQLSAYQIIMGKRLDILEPQEEIPAKRVLLFKTLTGITEQQLKAWKDDCIERHGPEGNLIFLHELDHALKDINFLFEITYPDGEPYSPNDELLDHQDEEPQNLHYAIALTLTRCPFPKLDLPPKKNGKVHSYYAPADELANISFLELCTTFHLFEQYLKNHEEDTLHHLLAVLYRSPKPKTKDNKMAAYHGDKRQPYLHHEALVPKRKKRMATLPREVKQIMVFWFAGCRQQIIEQYPDLFNSPGSGKPSKYGWAATLMAMAGSLTELDNVSAQPADDALTYLDYLNEQAKQRELEAQMKKKAH
jgi:hypothetical protein